MSHVLRVDYPYPSTEPLLLSPFSRRECDYFTTDSLPVTLFASRFIYAGRPKSGQLPKS